VARRAVHGSILNLPDRAIDESLAPPAYGDPTGEHAVRNILSGADWSPHADWKLVGPWRDDGQPITVLLDSRLALEILRLLGRQAEVKQSRRGKNMRARLKKKTPGAPTPGAKSNQ
jgi:hypothetical protein